MKYNSIDNLSLLIDEVTLAHKKIIILNNSLSSNELSQNELINNKALMIIDILDLIENIDEQEHDNSLYVYIKKIKKKLINILTSLEIEEIVFPENRITNGHVRVIETQIPDSNHQSGTIVTIVRNGYIKQKTKVIRPADVITFR